MRDNVIELYGVRFPVSQRPVVRRAITPFPQRITLGDYRAGDHVVESELVLADFTGGIGILYAAPERSLDRYWWGTLDGRYRFLTLPPARFPRGNPGLVQRFISYNGAVYAFAGNTAYEYEETTGDWISRFTYPGALSDVVVHDGVLVTLTQSALVLYDGASGNTLELVAATTGQPYHAGYALASWDDKLFVLGIDNVMYWSADSLVAKIAAEVSPTLVAAGKLLYPSGWCRQLVLYPDQTGEVVIHAVGRDGLFVYDFPSERFYQTQFTWPASGRVGRAAVWRGQLLVPVGNTIYLYNGALVQVVGPDKDDGLPPEVSGNVLAVVPGHGYWFSVLATPGRVVGSTLEDDWDVNMPNLPEGWFPGASRTGAILVSPQSSYHTLALYADIADMGDVAVLSANDEYGLWVSTTNGVDFIPLPEGLHNPLQIPTQVFAESGSLVTSWWDMGWRNLDKLALSLSVNAIVPSGGSITFSIGFDGSDTWLPVGTVTTTGRTRFRIGNIQGIPFRLVRFLLEFQRGPDPRQAPLLIDAVFTFLRTPRLLHGWELNLQLTDPYCLEQVGVPAARLVATLEDLVRNRRAGTLRYIDEDGREVTRRVYITEMVASELVGPYREGRYQVSVIELDS
jgi:hypothetical protein